MESERAKSEFQSAFEMIEWAKTAGQSTGACWQSYIQKNPFRRAVELDEATGEFCHKIKQVVDLPSELRMHVHKVVCHLRHALDHGLGAAISIIDRPRRGHTCPFVQSHDALERDRKRTRLNSSH